MSEIELLPCPICASTHLFEERDSHGRRWTACKSCECRGPSESFRRSPPQVGRGMEEAAKAIEGSYIAHLVASNSELALAHKIRKFLAERIRALSSPPAEEGESPTAEDAARLILECTDIISEATAVKLAERIRALKE